MENEKDREPRNTNTTENPTEPQGKLIPFRAPGSGDDGDGDGDGDDDEGAFQDPGFGPISDVHPSDVGIAQDIIETFKNAGELVVHSEGRFWIWDGACWATVGELQQREWIYRYDGMTIGPASFLKLTHGKINSILKELAAMRSRPQFFDRPPLGIAAANGFVAFDERGRPTLLSHHPAQRQRFVLPGRWEEGRKPDDRLIRAFLAGTFKDQPDGSHNALVLAEILGAVAAGLGPKLKQPKAIILLGEKGDNGKSQVLTALERMVPPDATSAIPVTDFGRHRFAIRLVGKMLNISGELDSESSVRSSTFKSVITGDAISARDPYQPSVSFRPTATHVFACNVAPTFDGGMSRPVMRRLLVVKFERAIPKDEQVAEIGKRIADEEPDALLYYAVRGATRLIQRGRFSEPRGSRQALARWAEEADAVLSFLADSECVEIVKGPNAPRVRSSVVYEGFRAWAGERGFGHLPNINQFVNRAEAAGKGITRARDGKARYLVGVLLTS